MIFLISQRQDKKEHNILIDSLEKEYTSYFEKFGITLVPVPNAAKNLEVYFDAIPVSGIILSGGNDINPLLYGKEKEPEMSISEARDKIEKELLDFAVKNKIPVFGICRGMQFINVYFGGSLIKMQEKTIKNHVATKHHIKISDNLFAFLGNEEVNSYHKFGVDCSSLSKELKPFASSEGGIIEGIYHPTLPIIGIQWHPERGEIKEINNKIIKFIFKLK